MLFLSWFWRMGIYVWILIFCIFYGIKQKWHKEFIILSAYLALALTVFFSPVMLIRYMFAFYLSFPLLLLVPLLYRSKIPNLTFKGKKARLKVNEKNEK